MANKKSSSTTFKYNNIDDNKIFDVLENKVIDKSQFIKNALYYYTVMVESGKVIDRNLPQEIKVQSDNVTNFLESLLSQQNNHVKSEVNQNKDTQNGVDDNIQEPGDNTEGKGEELVIPDALQNVDEADFNF